jgi:acetylornithine/succinyldiaminopimelate/putrescine aminotransferase
MNTLRSLFQQYVGQTSDEPFGLEVQKAEGIYIYDQDDKPYIDLIAGIGPASVGHSHPKVLAAGKQQMDRFMHTMVYGEHIQQPQIELAEYLAALLPDPIQSTYFVNSGAEAAEAAMKLAKKATGRFEIIACQNAYHGSTHATSALMSDDTYARAFRPFVPGVRFIEYNNKESLERITTKTAAVFIETMQGEAGCRGASACFMRALRERCHQTGTLLVMDEIQTGLGRTGKPFGFMHYEIQPDILLLAKALGGGMPLGAFLTSRDLMAEMSRNPILGHCTTFGGHPVSCATGKAAVEVIMENRLYEQAEDKALRFRSALQKHPMVKGISGKGLWMAVDVGTFEIVQQLMWWSKEEGLITDWFLYNDHSFRICPPLTISELEIDQALDILLPVLDRLEKKFG